MRILKKLKHIDQRGSLYSVYLHSDIPNINFVQDKISRSRYGTIRGLHGDDHTYKLMTCLYGRLKLILYDVDNDQKHSFVLSGDGGSLTTVLVPPRWLNGHQVLTDESILYYKWSEYYTKPEDQWLVYYNDPTINPDWLDLKRKIISERDMNAGSLEELKKHVI